MLVAICLYILNNLAGNIYFINKNINNASFKRIEHQLQTIIPANSTVVTQAHLWTALHHTRVILYNNLHTNSVNDIHYIVLSKTFQNEKSPITDLKHDIYQSNHYQKRIYNNLVDIGMQYGTLQETVTLDGYGDIEIWHIDQ